MNTHTLKTDPQPFSDVIRGAKRFEIRKDDRDFNISDCLILKETANTGAEMARGAPLIYTGRRFPVTVTHIMRGPVYGLADGWAILSIEPVHLT